MIIFGGVKDITRETNDMYSYNFEGNSWICFQGEQQVKDPVTSEQLEEYKKSKASPTLPKSKNDCNSPTRSPGLPKHKQDCSSPTRSPARRQGANNSPHGEHSPIRRKTLYDGPATLISGRIKGNAPHARDGHSAVMVDNIMTIFGGDRHQMPFNDVYAYTLLDHIITTPLISN
mmetsp:Transcript_10364/g.10331  ORF Transcript_10364/g.10331 Transcript_10364/m.10331 type:complete len:174 (+) Transcript_10364:790-1311(+)